MLQGGSAELTPSSLTTLTPPGLHDFVVDRVLTRLVQAGERAVDLGAGSGLLATRMNGLGWDAIERITMWRRSRPLCHFGKPMRPFVDATPSY